MFKKVIIASSIVSIVALSALAETAPVPIDMQVDTTKFIDNMIANQDKVGGWVITNRIKKDNHENFLATFTALKNQSVNQKDIEGLAFDNSIDYSKDSLKALSTLSALPKDIHLNKKEKALVSSIIKDKVIEITTSYSTKDYKFNGGLKDIDKTFNDVKVLTSDIKFQGRYNPNDILAQESTFLVKSVNITPQQKRHKGEYLTVKDIKIGSTSVADKKKISLKTHLSVGSLDAKIMKRVSDVKNLTLDTTIANLDIKSYLALIKLIQDKPTDYIDDPKLFPLLTELLTAKDISISIDNLSIDKLIVKGKDMGHGKIVAKVSLKNDPNLAKMIAMSPLMALSALQVTAHIQLSQKMFDAIMKDKRAFMLGMLPQQKKGDMIVYNISFKDGKLLVNGKPLAPPMGRH